jgi:hypothetical protein
MTRLVEEVGYPSAVDIRTEFTQILTDIETEMADVLDERTGPARPLYEMLAYHLGLDPNAPQRGGKRIRPLLGLLAYQAPRPSSWGTTSASSTTTSRTPTRSAAIGPRSGPCGASRSRSTLAMPCSR